jgi:sigma-B regulation protein RsbU (phosphoserine phosphatase)
LGVVEGKQFNLSEEAVELQPRDRLVLYTDGLVDVVAPSGKLYDRPRLIGLIKKHASLPAAQMCEAVLADLADYRGDAEPFDDMTMLVMEVEDISPPSMPNRDQT